MGFLLLLLATAMLFVRPAELFSELEGVALYQMAIMACAMVSIPIVLEQLRPESLASRPVTACVLGLLGAVVLSHIANTSLWHARVQGGDFAKLGLFYLLVVGLLDSPARLRGYLRSLVVFTLILTVVALLQFWSVIDIPALAQVEETGVNPETGETLQFTRLCGAGIFNDPNDLALILVVGIGICAYRLGGAGLCRLAWLAPLGVFGYALTLTQSRGGLLALLVMLLVLLWARVGTWKGLIVAAGLFPVLLRFIGSRQADLQLDDGTGQTRLQLWAEGLSAFRQAPLFGIGPGRYAEEFGLVAHNSYIHSYTETGILGGTCFVAAFFLALWMLYRLGTVAQPRADAELCRLRPYLLAIVAGYATGILTLTRIDVAPTYLILGLVTAYTCLAQGESAEPAFRLDMQQVCRLALVSIAFIVGTQAFVLFFVQWG